MIHSPPLLLLLKARIYEILFKVKPIPFFIKWHLPYIISNHLASSTVH